MGVRLLAKMLLCAGEVMNVSGEKTVPVTPDGLSPKTDRRGFYLDFYSAFDGITPDMVMRWATANPGSLLDDLGAPVGVIAAGAKADLIVVDGDPLTDPRLFARPQQHLKLVMVGGETLIDRLAS